MNAFDCCLYPSAMRNHPHQRRQLSSLMNSRFTPVRICDFTYLNTFFIHFISLRYLTGSKIKHFKALHARSGIPYTEMVFNIWQAFKKKYWKKKLFTFYHSFFLTMNVGMRKSKPLVSDRQCLITMSYSFLFSYYPIHFVGVTFKLVPSGLTQQIFEEGLEKWRTSIKLRDSETNWDFFYHAKQPAICTLRSVHAMLTSVVSTSSAFILWVFPNTLFNDVVQHSAIYIYLKQRLWHKRKPCWDPPSGRMADFTHKQFWNHFQDILQDES